ncbi:MAG: class I SAM-dependent methyltransferase [Candidatus Paceibacterota bacterium]|jgi:SAM-dependent methyltransferase
MALYNTRFSETTSGSSSLRRMIHEKKILQLLKPKQDDVILDFGCNKGDLVSFLRSHSENVYGCDVNREAIENSPVKGLSLISEKGLGYKNNSFDKIVSSHVIEHISDLKRTFEEIERVLRPTGTCVLIYPLEIFRGSNNLIQCWKIYGNPLYSRKLHVQKLNPGKIKRLTGMKLIKKGIFFAPFPTYYTVLKNEE